MRERKGDRETIGLVAAAAAAARKRPGCIVIVYNCCPPSKMSWIWSVAGGELEIPKHSLALTAVNSQTSRWRSI